VYAELDSMIRPSESFLHPTFCVLPFYAIEIPKNWSCCLMSTEMLTNGAQSLKEVQQQMLSKQRPKACNKCWKLEDAGLKSDRMVKNANLDYVTNIDLEHLINESQAGKNKIIHYDKRFNAINQVSKQISFIATDIPDLIVGSYITLAEETFVPNIPTELHPILAQRVAVACLEAMGDEQNKQSAERKLATMEKDAATFLDNRVEGAMQKIKSRHSPLVNTLNTLGRRNRRW
jgi:hypothetical protein